MTPKYVKFNGVQSNASNLGLVVQTPPTYQYPARSVEKTQIPGRNGSLVIDNENYANVTRQYSFAKIFANNETYVDMASEILAWLQSGNGRYVRLEDEYDPNVYRLAMYDEGNSFVNYFDGAISVVANFDCKPQRFLKSGEHEHIAGDATYPIIVDTSAYTYMCIANSTKYAALPIIKIKGSWINGSSRTSGKILSGNIKIENTSSLTIQGATWSTVGYISFNQIPIPTSWSVTGAGDIWIILDSDKKECYISNTLNDTENISDYVNFNGYDFPILKPGLTKFSFIEPGEVSYTVESYNNLVSRAQLHCKSVYMPMKKIEELKENMLVMPAYSAVMEAFMTSNKPASFSQHLFDICEKNNMNNGTVITNHYTLKSITSILNSERGVAYITRNSDGSFVYDEVSLEKIGININTTTGAIYRSSSGGMFYSTSDKSSKITLYLNGSTIVTLTAGKSITIYGYPTGNNSQYYYLDCKHGDLPSCYEEYWSYSVEDPAATGVTVKKYSVYTKNQYSGWIYHEKVNLLDKETWKRYSGYAEVLTLSWVASKQGFLPAVLGNKTVNSDYDLYFVNTSSDDNYQYSFDNIDTVFKITNEQGRTSDVNNVVLTSINSGWYKVTIGGVVTGGSNTGGWEFKSANSTIVSQVSSTKTFDVDYISASSSSIYPTYKDYFIKNFKSVPEKGITDKDTQNDWTLKFSMTFEDVNPVGGIPFTGTGQSPFSESSTIVLHTLEDESAMTIKNIRFKLIKDDVKDYIGWWPNVIHNTNKTLSGNTRGTDPAQTQAVTYGDGYNLSTIAVIPIGYDDDRAYYYLEQGATEETIHEEPPTWLRTEIETTTEDDGTIKKTITYYTDNVPVSSTYKYKWGVAIAWQNKADNQMLTSDSNENDLDLYCLTSVPQYSDISVLSYLNLQVNEDADGNFTDVQYIINSGGDNKNYRVNYQTYWKVYKTGDELHDATVDESVIVKIISTETNILASADDASNGKVGPHHLKIVPNWWKL